MTATRLTGVLSRLPNRRAVGRFLSEVRRPTRMSAARAVVDGAIVAVTLRRRGARPLLEGVDDGTARVDTDRAVRVSSAVDAGLALLPVAPTCLRRSVVLARELKRLGISSAIHIGVRVVAGAVEAHAWVQSGATVVNDDAELTATYVELAAGDFARHLTLLK